MNPSSIITLTTDFGITDPYVGTMKGVILSINPQATIVDITHQIGPQDIIGGSFALSIAYSFFPKGTIHIAVIDPGVGGPRRPILIETPQYFFIGPDNGIFSFILTTGDVKKVFETTNSSYFLPNLSATFHGRDIFAPVAAHLSTGTPPACFGDPIEDSVIINFPEPVIISETEVEGEVIHIDRFGNLITNLPRRSIEKNIGKSSFWAEMKATAISRHLPAYGFAEEGELFCLFGSSGFLEVSVKNGSAREVLDAQKGDRIRIKKSQKRMDLFE